MGSHFSEMNSASTSVGEVVMKERGFGTNHLSYFCECWQDTETPRVGKRKITILHIFRAATVGREKKNS